jgi:carbon monoxide dehydrogenase subunit G
MIVEDSFHVDAPIDRVWPLLADIPRVARCIPGAEIDERIDDKTFRARVSVKVGPVAVGYRATVQVIELDDARHVARFDVRGDETKGRGGVRAVVTSSATKAEGRTHVTLHADAHLSGIIVTVGGRLIDSVAKKTIAQFATNLSAELA